MDYKKKYLKYKIKYLKLNQIKHKKIKGGNLSPEIIRLIGLGSVGLFTILGILYKIFSKKKDEIETTDLGELKLNQLVNQTESDSIDELKKEIFESTNKQELKVLENKYFDIKNQLKDTEEKRKEELDKQESADLKERIIYQHNKTGLLLKNNSLDEERYKKLLSNIKILEEKYIILFDKERERRENLIINDYSKKLEELEVDYSKKIEEKLKEKKMELKEYSSLDEQLKEMELKEYSSLDEEEKADIKQQLYRNLETEYKNKMKYLNDDMNNLDKKLKLHAVNFYLDYCEKKYLTGKLCDYKKDVLETEKNVVKKYNDEQEKLKDLMETIRERLAELKNNNPNDTDEISHYEYLLDYYNNYNNNNNFIKDVQKINQEIIETQIEIEQIFEKNKNENETKIDNTIERIKDTKIKTIEEALNNELNGIYEKKIQIIKEDHEKRKAKNQQIIDEKEKDRMEKVVALKNAKIESNKNKEALDEINQHDPQFMREKLFLKEHENSKDKKFIKIIENIKEKHKKRRERPELIIKKKQSITLIKSLNEKIDELTEKIKQLKQDSVLVLPKIDTFKQDIEDYSKLLIKKFLTTEERQYYEEQNPKLKEKIANWIKETDVYNKYTDKRAKRAEEMSLGGKKTSS